jgi:predicted pyridoxine 5'-phosphate oxidase superfamily flavin-nucleotide-binding protein
MAHRFLDLAFTPSVLAAQQRYFGRSQVLPPAPGDDALGPEEKAFIESRDSFYLSSVSETGWPYVQHRGGPVGFAKVVSPSEIVFADYKGNRQMLTTGNVASNDRVCLFLMDYPQRERLKIFGHAELLDAREHPDLVSQAAASELAKNVERVVRIRVVGFDWNCPKFITPRYTADEVQIAMEPLKARIRQLEEELASLQVGTIRNA